MLTRFKICIILIIGRYVGYLSLDLLVSYIKLSLGGVALPPPSRPSMVNSKSHLLLKNYNEVTTVVNIIGMPLRDLHHNIMSFSLAIYLYDAIPQDEWAV